MESIADAIKHLPGIGDFELLRVMAAEHYLKPALMSAGIITDDMIALEIGVGRGMKAAVFCDLFSEYIGVDLDQGELEVAHRVARSLDLNYKLHCANAIDIIKSPSSFGLSKRPDFLILYAVLEHLLPDERTEILRAAHEIVAHGGAIFIAETPNRLLPFDCHTTHQHFVQGLEPSLAIRYAASSPRHDFLHSFMTLGGDRNAFFRCGSGLSYHDFELDFSGKSTVTMPFVFTGWSPQSLSLQPLQRDETWLHDYLIDNEIEAHPAFSRFWLEGLLSHKAPRHHRSTYFGVAKNFAGEVIRGRRYFETDNYVVNQRQPLTFEFGKLEGEEFELLIHVRRGTALDHSFVETAQGRFELRCDLTAGTRIWHDMGIVSILQHHPPSSVTISNSSNDPLMIQSALVNGYVRPPSFRRASGSTDRPT